MLTYVFLYAIISITRKEYTITVKRKGHNSIVIPAEIKLAYPEAVKKGTLSVEVKEEK